MDDDDSLDEGESPLMEEGTPMATETEDFMSDVDESTEDDESIPQDDEELMTGGEDAEFLATETDGAQSAPASGFRRKRNILAIAILLIAIIAGVLAGVLSGGKDKDGNSSSSSKSIEEPNNATDAPVNDPTNPPTQATVPVDPVDPEATTVEPEATTPPDPIPEFEFYQAVGPLSVEVPIYSAEDAVAVFETEEEAQDAFSKAGLFLMNNVILRSLGEKGFEKVALGNERQGFARETVDSVGVPEKGVEAVEVGGGANEDDGSDATDGLGNANGYDTNNQEDKVDQSDFSKSDGTFIYTAFGDQLVIMRAEKVEDSAAADPEEEQLVLRLQMPEIEWPAVEQGSPCYVEAVADVIDNIFAGAQETVALQEDADSDTGSGGGGGVAAESRIGDAASMQECYYRSPKPYIRSLLLSEGRLGVIVSGYGDHFRAELNETTVISDFLGTHVRLYDTSSLDTTGELKLLGVQDVHGYFQEAFMIDSVAHIVTMTSLNTWDYVIYKTQRSNPDFAQLDTDQYLERVKSSAGSIAERFSTRLIQELSLSTSVFPKIATLALAIEGVSDEPGLENVIFGDGYLNSMVQISSFDTQEGAVKEDTAVLEEPELQLKQTVKFLPTLWAQVYSAADKLVVAGQGSRWDPRLRGAEETTHLFTFDLNGTVVTPEASGTVPGSLLNEYSIDYVDGYLRVATTIRNQWLLDAVFTERSTNSTPPVSTMADGNAGSVGGPGLRALQVINEPTLNETLIPVVDCSNLTDVCMEDDTVSRCNLLKTDLKCQPRLLYTTESCNFFCEDDLNDSKCRLPLPDGCMTVPNFMRCLSLEKEGCEDLILGDLNGNVSCPYPRVQCGQNFGGGQPPSKCPVTSQDPSCEDEERIKECLEVESKCRNLNITNESCPLEFTCLDDQVNNEPALNDTLIPVVDCSNLTDVCMEDGTAVSRCNLLKTDDNLKCQSTLLYTPESCNFICEDDLNDTQCPPPGGCMTVPNFMHCRLLEQEGCEDLIFGDLNGTVPGTVNGTAQCPSPMVQCGNFGQPLSKCPVTSQDPSCKDEERIKECLEVESKCRNLNITKESCPLEFTCLDDQVNNEPALNDTLIPVVDCSNLTDVCMEDGTAVSRCNLLKTDNNLKCQSTLLYTTESCNFFCKDDSQCPLPDGCMTVPNFMHCRLLEQEGCEDLIFGDLNGTVPGTVNGTAQCPSPMVQCGNFGQPPSKCPVTSQDPSCEVEGERIKECLEVESKCQNLNITNECPLEFTCLDDGTGGNKTMCPEIDDKCVTEERHQECKAIERNCDKLWFEKKCPIEFVCLDEETGGNETNCPAIDPDCFDEGRHQTCIAMERNCREFRITDACPVTLESSCCLVEFSCLDDSNGRPGLPAGSSTLNQLFVLNINAANSTRLEIVGNVTLGEENEGTLRKSVMFCTLTHSRS
jgi:hypothetical protein